MSPLLRRVLEYLREQGPQTEEDPLAAFQVKRAIITRLLKDARGQVRQQGEYFFLPEQEERVGELHAVPRALISSYVVLDTETTSLDRAEAQLLEVAALKVQEGRVVATLQLLVSGVLLPGKVAELTGLSQEELNREGQSLSEVLADLVAFLEDLPVVGHNAAAFDVPLLRRICWEQGVAFRPRFVLDTLLLAPLAFAAEEPPVEAYSLGGLHTRFCGEVHDDAHRALADCAATCRVLDQMTARLRALPGDTQALLAALPVPELALAYHPAALTGAALQDLSAQIAGAAAPVSAVWSSGRRVVSVQEMLPVPRPGQERMALDVAGILAGEGKLVVEAPTGTGKTRAYLYPALLHGAPGRTAG